MGIIKEYKSETVDTSTGEIKKIESITIAKTQGDKAFVKIYPACTDKVLEDLKIEDGRIRLLFWFVKKIQDDIKPNTEQIIIAPVSEIARELGASEPAVRRWLSVLIERGYVQRYTMMGKVIYNTYIVNKEYIYKGTLAKTRGGV